jgi:hypothetical protein
MHFISDSCRRERARARACVCGGGGSFTAMNNAQEHGVEQTR